MISWNKGGGRCHIDKNGKEASEDTEESPAGCAEEGKQNKGNKMKEHQADIIKRKPMSNV